MPEHDLPIPDPVLRLLWRGVELGVFVVLIAKDRRVPSWSCPRPDAHPGDVSVGVFQHGGRRVDLVRSR